MRDIKSLFERFADDPYITCDTEKCGQCAKEKLRSEVCKDFLNQGKCNSTQDLIDMENELKVRWENNPIFLQVRSFMNKGMTVEDAIKEVQKLGIDP